MFEEEVLNLCKHKQTVFMFVSKKDEIQTHEIIEKLLILRVEVVVPVSIEKNKKLNLSKIYSTNDLIHGTYGILEPKNIISVRKEDIDIFFVPGTMFDKNGNRKGRGFGYFDRFLADIKGKKPIIGLCFEKQVVEELEVNPWDVPVDQVVVKS